MAQNKQYLLKQTLHTLVSFLADDDDESLAEHEHKLFTKAVSDLNQSHTVQVALLSQVACQKTKIVRRTDVEHNDSFCDEEVPKLNVETFKSLFGVSRSVVQVLSEKLAAESAHFVTKFKVPLQKRVLMTLWVLSNQESFRSIGERFGMMAPGNVHYVFYSMCDSICSLSGDLVHWPNNLQQYLLSNQIKKDYKVPNVFGVLGCYYITIKSPDKNEHYYNHKGIPSVAVQAVCDNSLTFLDLYIGQPGSFTPGKVFKNSPLSLKLNDIVADNLFVMAGLDYPPNPKLLLTNRCIKSAHRTLLCLFMQAFSKMIGTFQRLKYLDMQRPQATVKLIQTACTLHNLAIGQEEEYPSEFCEIDTCDQYPTDLATAIQ